MTTRNSAGRSRLARRPQKAARLMRPDRDPLLEQERRDEEPGEDEEEIDTEIATRRPPELEVVGDDADARRRLAGR